MVTIVKPEDNYDKNVFLNCPFDNNYVPRLKVITFAVSYLGFTPRCAKELVGNEPRLDKIKRIISECRFGIHDISRIGRSKNGYPRFNMPFELGLDMGCAAYGENHHKEKRILVLDTKHFRYQKFISDLNGHDPTIYDGTMHGIITAVRDWMRPFVPTIPAGGQAIYKDYLSFRKDEPHLRHELKLDLGKTFSFRDHFDLIEAWVKDNV